MENTQLPKNEVEFIKNSSRDSLFIKSAIIFVVFLFLFSIFYFLFLSAPNNFPSQSIISIEKGATLTSISEDLKEKKIIRSKVLFEAFVIIYGGENHIAQGDYLFEGKLPVFEVARRISKRDRHLATVKVTIPEGFDSAQISDTFSAKLRNFNEENFLLEAKNKEGYLFPDTYFFFTTDNEQDVIKYMSDNFNKKIKLVERDIISTGKNQNEIIIMASLIEREAKGDSDRGIISGILWNRISKKMPLQVDAAPDTYKTRGLPESPICNPGIEAIRAAIKPNASNYLYYIHDKNGVIHYARSFTEHKKNISKYLK
ncbi:MAG: endolytic transglycosylase MltG [bacterium]